MNNVQAAHAALLAEIDTKIGEVRTDAIDLSFGEIINLKSTRLIQNPAFIPLVERATLPLSRIGFIAASDPPDIPDRKRGRNLGTYRWPATA
jgi:hypothetical protein